MPPDRLLKRVALIARSHYGMGPTAFEQWQNHAPRLEAASPKDNEILIYGLILPHEEVTFLQDCFGDETALSGKMFSERLADINGDVMIRVNSDGGDAMECSVMLQAIREHKAKAKVSCTIDGMAASAASVIVAGCSDVTMAEMGTLMVHEAHAVIGGTADMHRKGAAYLDSLNQSCAAVYAKRTGKSEKDMLALMAEETFMSAKEAMDAGFVDRIADTPADDGAATAVMQSRNRRAARLLAALT